MAEIKISDLSIGDWVNQKMNDGAYQVQWIERENVGLIKRTGTEEEGSIHLTAVPLSFIEPIPLTPEILEKNGFKNKGEYERKRERIGIFRMSTGALIKENERRYIVQFWHSHKRQVLGVTDTVSISDRTWGDSCSLNKHNKQCIYVHQLQHALRLAGVEKEIEL